MLDIFKNQYVFQLHNNEIINTSPLFNNLFDEDILNKPISNFIKHLPQIKYNETEIIKINTKEYNITSLELLDKTIYYFLAPIEVNDPQEIFLAKMSHELKTLLNGIIGMAELLNDTILTSKQTEYMNTINQCSNQLLAIINDILDFTKMRTGKLKLKPEPFNVRECIEEALDVVVLKATKKGLQLYQDPPKINTVSYIIADKARLRQIIINLLENAIKYTDKGDVVITYSEERNASDTLIFSVRDTGCGIPEDKHTSIFTAFNSDISHASGTGLGLAIVKNLVEIMGGNITVKSKVNKGSTFTFTIKADLSCSENSDSPNSSISPKSVIMHDDNSLADKTVLIVDDKPFNRTIISRHVIKWYMNPVMCGSAMEAMTYIDNNYTFDIALIDIHMPDTDGIQLAKQIKSVCPNLPIIALSSLLDDPLSLNDANTTIFTNAISKPIKSQKLYTMIMKILKPEYETKYTKELAFQPKKQLKILLVEDVKFNQDVIVGYLKKIGYYDITTAYSGPEALHILHSQEFNVIFMDISMVPMDGFETTSEIIKLFPNKFARPLIIAMTAHTNDTIKEQCFKIGMSAYLSKPVEIRKLKTLLELIEKKNNRGD